MSFLAIPGLFYFLTFTWMRGIHLNEFCLLTEGNAWVGARNLEPTWNAPPLSLHRSGKSPLGEGDRSDMLKEVSRIIPGQKFYVGLLLLLRDHEERCFRPVGFSHTDNNWVHVALACVSGLRLQVTERPRRDVFLCVIPRCICIFNSEIFINASSWWLLTAIDVFLFW